MPRGTDVYTARVMPEGDGQPDQPEKVESTLTKRVGVRSGLTRRKKEIAAAKK